MGNARMRRMAAFLTLLFCIDAQGGDVRLAEPSSGLAYSASEIARRGEREMTRFMQRTGQSGQLGCVLHCATVQNVWAALQPVFQSQGIEGSHALRLVVVRQSDVEALSFADGTVVISEAFISHANLQSAEIAFILAHEASHVLMQHERQTLTTMLALMPSTIKRTPGDLYVEMEYKYFSLSEPLSVMFHQVEFEADEIGMQLASMAGFQPDAQLKFMERQAGGDQERSMASTHPAAGQRLRRLQELLPLAWRIYQVRHD